MGELCTEDQEQLEFLSTGLQLKDSVTFQDLVEYDSRVPTSDMLTDEEA